MITESEKPPEGGLFARVENLFARLSQLSLFVLLTLVVVQIFTRYVLNDPMAETVAITETYLMPILVFFAISALQRADGHIRVDVVYINLKGRTKQVCDLFIYIVSAVFWAIVVYASASETLFSLEMGYEVSKNFPVPMASALAVVPIGGALICIRLVLQAISTAAALGRPVPADAVAS